WKGAGTMGRSLAPNVGSVSVLEATCSLGQISPVHQEAITFASGSPAFIERPDHQALTAACIAGGEDFRVASLESAVVGFHIGARIALDSECFEQRLLRPEKTHCQKHQLHRADLFRSRNFFRDELALVVPG